MDKKNVKQVVFNILLIIVSISVSFLFVEFSLRFTQYQSLLVDFGPSRFYFIADEKTGYDITPEFENGVNIFSPYFKHKIWSNKLGCFDTPYENEQFFIYLAGDSFTWGFSPFNDKWGTFIEKLTGKRTLKCGVSGFGTKQELLKAKKILSKLKNNPELIIVGYLPKNDPYDDYDFLKHSVYNGYLITDTSDDYKNLSKEERQEKFGQKYELFSKYCMSELPKNPVVQRTKCLLSKNSIVYNITKKSTKSIVKSVLGENFIDKIGLVNITPPKKTVLESDIFEKHFESIRQFKKFAEEQNARLLFVIIPSIEEIYTEGLSENNKESLSEYEKVKRFLRKENIDFIDLAPEFLKYAYNDFYWEIDRHLNIEGNHITGFIVSKFILENNFITVTRKEERIKNIVDKLEKEFEKNTNQ